MSKVLIVDDEEVVVELYKLIIGYRVQVQFISAKDAESAKKYLEEDKEIKAILCSHKSKSTMAQDTFNTTL